MNNSSCRQVQAAARHKGEMTMKKNGTPKGTTSTENLKNTSREAQRARILNALEQVGAKGITTLECRESLNVMSPASRIFELRDEGHRIETIRTDEINQEGYRHNIARYVLIATSAEVA